jgi:catechol 2,3-dioxygenase-like lactoylglutathione lyase family enzyme
MPINQSLGLISLVVRDYDEALSFFVGRLGFILIEDTYVPDQNKRWVVIKPNGSGGACLLLARASTVEQNAAVGNQTGGRVFLFLYTDNFWHDYEIYKDKGIEFVRLPEQQPHGTVAVFKDVAGNLWDLIEPDQNNKSWPA